MDEPEDSPSLKVLNDLDFAKLLAILARLSNRLESCKSCILFCSGCSWHLLLTFIKDLQELGLLAHDWRLCFG